MFASSFPHLQQMGGQRSHPPNSHESIQGKVDEWGNFEGRKTACYPSLLADKFASLIIPLLTGPAQDLEWNHRFTIQTKKQFADFPFSQEDGGGFSPHRTGVELTDRNRITLDPFANNVLNVLLMVAPTKFSWHMWDQTMQTPLFLKKFCCHSARI